MRFCICQDVHDRDKTGLKSKKTNLIYTIIDTEEKVNEYPIKEYPFNSVKLLKHQLEEKHIEVETFFYYSQKKGGYIEYKWEDIVIPDFWKQMKFA